MIAHTKDRRLFGLLVVTLATVLWSTAGIFMRLTDLDVWAVLGWRSLFAMLALLLMVFINNGRSTPRLFVKPTRALLSAIPIATVSMGAYVLALNLTTVANVMIVYATVPLIAAGISFLTIGEKTTKQVLTVSLLAFAGVVFMVGGASRLTDVAGCAIALLMTVAMAIQIIMARKNHVLDMAIVNAFAALACAFIGLTFSHSGIPSLYELLVMAAFGISNTALAYYFVMIGARHIPSAEVGLIGMIDVILGPLWVWLLFAENPGQKTLIGGAVVLCAVGYYLLSQLKHQGVKT
jgi:drug/metabolite transporter (DMT)-like permease